MPPDHSDLSDVFYMEFWNGVEWERNRRLGVMAWEEWNQVERDIRLNFETTPWRLVGLYLKDTSERR